MIDTRGYSCPMPVLLVQKAVEAQPAEPLEVLADNRCAVENISRFANHNGYSVTVEEVGEEYRLLLKK